MIYMMECGCCGCFHPANWFGDCREDRYRIVDPWAFDTLGIAWTEVADDDDEAEVTDEQFADGPVLFSSGVVRDNAAELEQALDAYHATN